MAINSFDRLTSFKEELIYRFTNSEDLCKLVYYNTPDALSNPSLTNPLDLIYTNLFPFRFIPDVANEMKTYVTLDFTDFELTKSNPKFINFNLLVYVFTHKDLFVTDDGLRMDLLLNLVDVEIQEKRLGFGDVYLHLCRSFWFDKDYGGYYLEYRMFE